MPDSELHLSPNLEDCVDCFKYIVGGVPSQLILGCRWYAVLLTRSVNTQLALCGALDVTGRRLIAVAGRLQLKSADGVASWKTAGSVALH
jgi:hypothetical protein